MEHIERTNNCIHSVFRGYFGEYECKIRQSIVYSSIHCEGCKFYEENTMLDYTGFEDYLSFIDSRNGGKQYTFIFDNGYGASVINNEYSYGGKDGLFELAVLKKIEDEQYELTYSTPIAGDVIGHLTSDDVRNYLKQIRELKGDEVDE